MSQEPTAPPDLPTDPAAFYRTGDEAPALDSLNISETSALEILGPSPFPKSGFPLLGFLESVYEHLATHAAQRRTG